MWTAAVPCVLALAQGFPGPDGFEFVQETNRNYGEFGVATVWRGERFLVGAPGDDVASIVDSGSVSLFELEGGQWGDLPFWPEPLASGLEFGAAVALTDSTAIVGAPGSGAAADSGGAVYVFALGSAPSPLLVQRFVAHDARPGDRFGAALALEGDRLVVGAPFADAGAPDAGAAYVFELVAGLWVERAKLVPTPALADARAGSAVASVNGLVVLGAPGSDLVAPEAGAAHLFGSDGVHWEQRATFTAPHATAGDHFASAIAMAGDYLAVGSPDADVAALDAGAVHVFERVAEGWSGPLELARAVLHVGDHFGRSVALTTDGILVAGAPGDDSAATNSGAAYVYRRRAGIWARTARLTSQYGWAGQAVGRSVAMDACHIVLSAPDTRPLSSIGSQPSVVVYRCLTPIVTFCAGDGTSAPCPCGQPSSSWNGCGNSATQYGASAYADGIACLAWDSLGVVATGLPAGPAFLLQSDAATSPTPFGAGLVCLAPPWRRVAHDITTGTWFVPVHDSPLRLSHLGGVLAPGSRCYQILFRDEMPGCAVRGINLTNAFVVHWIP